MADVGTQAQNRDVFAEFDECRVAPVVGDSALPAKASLRTKTPDILSWPPSAATALASKDGCIPMHLYRLAHPLRL